ncbi:hypothetical protein Bca52824_081202 [Brassica carinata]|uniref:Uncharacterized protein n=1 Tax=Brassica carinata TaxID=52824 RepID=A0A8X7PFX4_BRACI|nr:hypothetical protein Bca52824_081202 [Brassica carinata]
MNRYGASFKFPDDEVIKSPSCLYGHDYTMILKVLVKPQAILDMLQHFSHPLGLYLCYPRCYLFSIV